MEKMKFKGYVSFLSTLYDGLLMKHNVALFDNYDDAIKMLMLEYFPHSNANSDKADELVKWLEENTDVREWFNNLG